MSADRVRRVRELFDGAVSLAARERDAFLGRECRGDETLRRQISAMLSIDAAPAVPLDQPLFGGGLDVERFAEAAHSGPTGPAAALPERIGRYRILAWLGAGGMGVVYRAEQDSPQRQVALKTLRPGMQTRRILGRFNNEIVSLARLRHECIAQIYDAGVADAPWGPAPYIAMELVDGPPLLEYAASRNLDVAAKLELFVRLCEGVQYAHLHGVIHRDLKPANILVTEAGSGLPAAVDAAASQRIRLPGKPKILDFGVSRLTQREELQPSLATREGELVGTLTYMSPEQVQGDPNDLDTRTDIYSLGAILYELLSGKPPIEIASTSIAAAAQRICDHTPPSISKTLKSAGHGGFGEDLNTILAKTLEKDRNRRYVSAAALGEDIRRYLRNEPISARPASAWYIARKFTRRHRALVVAAAGIAITLTLGAFGTVYGLVRARAAAAEKQRVMEEAIDAVGAIAHDVLPPLGSTAGTAKPRRALLEQLLHLHDTLYGSDPSSVRLITARASMLASISELERAEGKRDTALAHRREARELGARAVELDPADGGRRRSLAYYCVLVGDMYKEGGDRQEAEKQYREAFRIQQELLSQTPDAVDVLDDFAFSHQRLGENAFACGRFDTAAVHLGDCIRTAKRLRELAPDRLSVLDAMQGAQGILADLANKSGGCVSPMTHLNERIISLRELVRREPTNFAYKTALIATLSGRTCWLLQSGDCDLAAQGVAQALAMTEALRHLDPDHVELLQFLSWNHGAAADVATYKGRPDVALLEARRAWEVACVYALASSENLLGVDVMVSAASRLRTMCLAEGDCTAAWNVRQETLAVLYEISDRGTEIRKVQSLIAELENP